MAGGNDCGVFNLRLAFFDEARCLDTYAEDDMLAESAKDDAGCR